MTPTKPKGLKSLFSRGSAADKLEKRQKDSQRKKKFYQKEGFDRDEHSKNLARGLSAFSASGGSSGSGGSAASSGPASVGEAFQERKDRIASEDAQRANAAQQKELMTRLRALTGGE